MDRVEAIVVGAGVIGLAVARVLAASYGEALILERSSRFGSETSSRNSEVIHAGLYYPPGSLKARLCVEGRERLYEFCRTHGVEHRRIGKLIVARDGEAGVALDAIWATAAASGVSDLRRLSAAEARRMEPQLVAADAIFSPSTGIVDSHALMLALLGEAEAGGADLVSCTEVTRVARGPDGWRLWIGDDPDPAIATPRLVNAAGLDAPMLASRIEGLAADAIPRQRLARGTYFTYAGKVPFSHLIYPVPEPGGLGTHLTLDLAGQARFGPDVEWIDQVDYAVDPGRKSQFVAAARRLWPALDETLLQPGYAGVRPKLSGRGEPAADFMISGPGAHGLAGLVNLFGIESPGLTAALAIAERVKTALA